MLAQKTVLVPNVHAFPGHIACDSASVSEIVVPLFKGGGVFGVLDIDSPRRDRFSESDADCIERTCDHINDFLDWGQGDADPR